MGKGYTGTGSIREGQAFKIDPDLIRALQRGDAIVIWKNPSFLAEHIKLDFFGHPPYPGPIKALKGKEIEKAEVVQETKATVEEEEDKNAMPPDVADAHAYLREMENKDHLKDK